ncbi:MAG: alternate F1F0 ATPase, F1 subunit alpha [Gammaproteobacteria bacterium]|nr:alternate F1F0 ATPase, F1 subunit alpha [Gammaproteobacteria bacterium]
MADALDAQRLLRNLAGARAATSARIHATEVGVVHTVSAGVAQVYGLPGLGFEEVVRFENGASGIAFNIDEHDSGIVLLSDSTGIVSGAEVERTGRVADVPVGRAVLGRIINPLGMPLDDGEPLRTAERLPIERPAPHIMDRAPVTEPLQTGIKVIDAVLPIGRGQRELILGDRQTGKTAIALDTIINQADKHVICVYCAIGQRASSVAKAMGDLRAHGAQGYTVAVVTEGNDPPGLRYIAPYAATSIAEYFMAQGEDVLIIYDDLTHHARAYRELALLLRRPPGREAFPGDIFYLHARLLERATHLREELGGGSLTALPIVETEAENMSDYIPTNLISITDGQLYLSPRLFELGQLPAIDIGKSVSRVGGKAQSAVLRNVAGPLKLMYSQFEEMEAFSRFGTRIDDNTRRVLERGYRTRQVLQQPQFSPLTMADQVLVLLALTEGLLDDVPLERLVTAQNALIDCAREHCGGLLMLHDLREPISDAERARLLEMISRTLHPFTQSTATGA